MSCVLQSITRRNTCVYERYAAAVPNGKDSR